MQKIFSFFIILFFGLSSMTQVNLDSLWNVWNDESQADTNCLKAMHKIAWDGYLFSQPDSAFYFAQMEYDFASKTDKKQFMAKALATQVLALKYMSKLDSAINFGKRLLEINVVLGDESKIANTYFQIGLIYRKKGDNISSIRYYEKALKIFKDIDDKRGVINCFNNMGNCHNSNANKKEALDCFLNSLSVSKDIRDTNKIAMCLFSIGNIYLESSDYDKAFNYYDNSLVFYEKIENNKYVSSIKKNIGIIYSNQGNYEKALEYQTKSLEIDQEIGNKYGIASSFLSIANIYYEQGNYEKAMEYYLNSFKIFEELGNKKGMMTTYVNIGVVYYEKGIYEKALDYLLNSKNISQEINTIYGLDETSKYLSEVYKKLGKYKQALEMHELYMVTKDSIAKMDAEEELYKFEVDKEYDLKKQADSIKHADEILIQQAENLAKEEQLKSEKQRRTGLLIIVGLVLVSLGFVFVQLRKTKAQKVVIEGQHQKLNQSHQEISDSINYANRLQKGILPSETFVKNCLPNSFILFKPKDVVSGDFYWVEKVGAKIYFAVADCTGHGVPGAMVSIVCSNALTKSIFEDKISSVAKILDNTRIVVEKRFIRSEENISDGMDISLVCYHSKNNLIQWSGANNPLWIIRNDSEEIEEIKPTKQAIGKVINPQPFTEHEVQLNKGDNLYLFSDGFQDQFGGEKGKKYMKGRMKKLLLSIANKEMKDQEVILDKELNDWMGDLEQIDDVCVMGVRV